MNKQGKTKTLKPVIMSRDKLEKPRLLKKEAPERKEIFKIRSDLKKAKKALNEKTKQLEDLKENLGKCIEEKIKKNREQEQFLMQQSKYASMGEMVGAIAHQWRQPLTSIGFIVQNLQSAYEMGIFNGAYLDKSVEEAMSLIMFMSKTIDDFRNFFVYSKEEDVFDVVKAIEESLFLLNAQLVNNYIFVSLHAPEEKPLHILGFPNEFKQVVLNIISNAKNAILERRKKEKSTDENGHIDIDIGFHEGKIIIRIRNNGEKIAAEFLDKIFEPYFTTQKNGEGMGIGLNMAKNIIEKNMGGKIYAENVHDGAMFTIELNGEVGDA
jgi:C4-dicarboxylate-specific signal transduction histidine kinase